MSIRVFSWLLFIFMGVGLSLILFSAFHLLLEVFHWLRKPQGILSRASAMAARAEAARKPGFWMDVEFPWLTAYLITAPAVVMLWFALEGMSFQPAAFGVLLFPVLVRRWVLRQKRREAGNEIRQFLVELRLQLSSGGTLRPALQAVAQYGPPNLGRLLRRRLSSQENGVQVLRHIADDTGSRWISDVAGRAEAARDGMLNLDEAVSQSISRVTDEMDTEIREELQRIPTRLVVVVAPLILGPALAAWVLPVVARTIASLEGVTFFGSF
ncbi:MAG: type II secretion system F family protein [Anaerolineales bacterium]|nr:type II secretion system F family protein [Anaerolineales bacterium]